MHEPTFLGENVNFASYTGDSERGITVNYGACIPGTFHVMTINLMGSGETQSCCYIVPLGHPAAASGKIEVTDCAGTTFPVPGGASVINPELYCSDCGPDMIRPYVYGPLPPDSAESVSLNPSLTWETYNPQSASSSYEVYFGTTANPPKVEGYFGEDDYNPGELEPYMDYYWRVGVWWNASVQLGPVWKFTTLDPSPVKRSTWGAIKALYKQ
jgi:hypothetical protein